MFGSKTSKIAVKHLQNLKCLLIIAGIISVPFSLCSQSIIVNHNHTNIHQVPEYWIQQAKQLFKISYGHTSHGSQIVSGMQVLLAQSDLYAFNHDGTGEALSLHDRVPSGDLGNPNRSEWYHQTRDLLDSPNNDRNMILWSWCGQVSPATAADIDLYLSLMNQLEYDYPHVKFVYMTGHLDGTGETGNLNVRNEQIRAFCRANGKILFDFADIESFDPDGHGYLDKGANDGRSATGSSKMSDNKQSGKRSNR